LELLDRFLLTSPASNFTKIRPLGAALIHVGSRQTDKHYKAESDTSLFMLTRLKVLGKSDFGARLEAGIFRI